MSTSFTPGWAIEEVSPSVTASIPVVPIKKTQLGPKVDTPNNCTKLLINSVVGQTPNIFCKRTRIDNIYDSVRVSNAAKLPITSGTEVKLEFGGLGDVEVKTSDTSPSVIKTAPLNIGLYWRLPDTAIDTDEHLNQIITDLYSFLFSLLVTKYPTADKGGQTVLDFAQTLKGVTNVFDTYATTQGV
jgi:hypothetical protein